MAVRQAVGRMHVLVLVSPTSCLVVYEYRYSSYRGGGRLVEVYRHLAHVRPEDDRTGMSSRSRSSSPLHRRCNIDPPMAACAGRVLGLVQLGS